MDEYSCSSDCPYKKSCKVYVGQLIERVRAKLCTPDGRAELEKLVKKSEATLKKLERDAYVPREMLEQPMTI